MEERRRHLQEEIDQIVDKIGPEVSRRMGQFMVAKAQELENDIENMSPNLRKDYVSIFHKKAEVQDLKALAATSDYSREFHERAAEGFRVWRDLFTLS